MTSNVLEYAYQLRCLEDPAASDHTLSLDTYYNPVIRMKHPIYHIISADYLYKCERIQSKQKGIKEWPEKLTVAEQIFLKEKLLKTNVRFLAWQILPERGLLKIDFFGSRALPDCLFTPYYNLRKTSQTISE